MKIAVFQWFRCFVGSPPFGASCWPLAGLLASCWPLAGLAGLLLASCWPLAGFLLASSFPARISLENQFLGRLAKTVSVFRETPSIWGSFLASCWPLAGLLLASCWPLAGFVLASCWPLAGLLLTSCWLLAGFKLSHEDLSRKSVFGKARENVNSLHENSCFSMVSVFRGVPPIWGLFLASCWRLAGLLLASCWRLAGVLLASCWPLAGLLLASSWPLAGFLLASSFPTRISLENQFSGRLAKTVNFLHESGCFSWFRGISWGPPHLGPLPGFLLASSWLLAGVLLASCWPLAGLLLASCWLLAGLLPASCWPLAGLLLASCWLQASPRGFL